MNFKNKMKIQGMETFIDFQKDFKAFFPFCEDLFYLDAKPKLLGETFIS